MHPNPSYDLALFQKLFREDSRFMTGSAKRGSWDVGHCSTDVEECVCDVLREQHFYKTMPSQKMPGLWQDVYKVVFKDTALYVKIQISRGRAVLVSYKMDESAP